MNAKDHCPPDYAPAEEATKDKHFTMKAVFVLLFGLIVVILLAAVFS